MAKQQPRTEEELKDFNLAGQEFIQTIRSIGGALKENTDDIARLTGEAKQKSVLEDSAALTIGKQLAGLTKEQLKTKRTLSKVEGKYSKALSLQAEIESEIAFNTEIINRAKQEGTKISKDELELAEERVKALTAANQEFEKGLANVDELKDKLENIDKDVKIFDDLADLVGDVPVLSKLFKEFGNAAKAAREARVEDKSGFLAGLDQLTGVAAKGFLGLLVKNITVGQKRITDFSRQLNISRQQAQGVNNELAKAARNSGFLTDEMMQFQMATAETLGVSTNFNQENAKQSALLTQRLGLSVDQSQKLFELSAGIGQSFEDTNNGVVGQVLALNNANGTAIRYQTVLKDIADASTATALTTSKFPGGIAKAAFEARKFGLNLRQLESTSSALLDFQSSIEAELEAELLTGRALNLERARAAALTGDQATLAAELAKNFGTAKEFLDQNVLAQEAQAKALGMTREELAQTLSRQEALNKLAQDFPKIRFDGLSLEQKVAKLQEAGLTREQALKRLGEDELLRQEKNLSIQDNLAKVLDSLNNILTPISTAFDFIGNTLKFAGENAGILVGAMTAFAALRFRNISNLLKSFRGIGSLFGKGGGGGASQFAGGSFSAGKKMLAKKAVGKGITKGLGKTLLKKIPGVGLLAGIGFGLQRALSGDLAGGGLELASGITSMFPGIGTAASLGIDSALIARDLKRQKTISQNNQDVPLATGGIVTQPTRALVGEAGAEAVVPLREFYAKMDELISVVKQGGDVFMDGAKVGRATVLAGTNLS